MMPSGPYSWSCLKIMTRKGRVARPLRRVRNPAPKKIRSCWKVSVPKEKYQPNPIRRMAVMMTASRRRTISSIGRNYASDVGPARLPDPENILAFLARHGARVPRRRPGQVHLHIAGAGEAGANPVDLALQHRTDGTAGAGQRHFDLDVVLVDVDVVDQAEVDDVEPDLGVDDHLEGLPDLVGLDRSVAIRGLVVGAEVGAPGDLWLLALGLSHDDLLAGTSRPVTQPLQEGVPG